MGKSRFSDLLQRLVLIFLLSMLFGFIASLFSQNNYLVFLVTILSGSILHFECMHFIAYLRIKTAERNYSNFLQSLLSELNMNISLLKGISNASANVVRKSKNSKLRKDLIRVDRAINAGAPFKEIGNLLLDTFPCETANLSLSLLREPQNLGNKVNDLLKQTWNLLQDKEKLHSTIMADNAQKLVEAITIATMPSLILVFLKVSSPEFIMGTYENLNSQVLLMIAYTLFFISLIFIIKIFTPEREMQKKFRQIRVSSEIKSKPNSYKLTKSLSPALLYNEIYSTIEIISRQNNVSIEQSFTHLNKLLLRSAIYAVILGFLLLVIGVHWVLILLISLMLAVFPIIEFVSYKRSYIIEVKAELPELMQYMLLLISAGNNIEQSLKYILRNLKLNPWLSSELQQINSKLNAGITVNQAFHDLAMKLDDQTLKNYIEILESYFINISGEHLQALDGQLSQIKHHWNENRRKASTKRSGLYIIPMLLNLLAVFMVSIAPVLNSFIL